MLDADPDAVPASSGVTVQLLRLHPDAVVPQYADSLDAGADLVTLTSVELLPGERAVLSTGIALALPPGYAGFVHPRSGLAARCGLGMVNAPGIIDAGYRGEIKVVVINHDPAVPIRIEAGDRIAQLVIQRVEQARFVFVGQLSPSERGAGGFGSTGGAGALAGPTDTLQQQHDEPSPHSRSDGLGAAASRRQH